MAGIGRVFRRKYNKGHLSKFFSIAVPHAGREKIISTRTTSEAEARKILRMHLSASSSLPAKPPTLAEACAKWLEGKSVAESSRGGPIKPSTVQYWANHVNRHILRNSIVDYHIQNLTTDMIEQARDAWKAKGLSGKSVNAILQTLTAVLQNQMRLGNAVSNPAAVAQRLASGSHEVGEAGEMDLDEREVRPEAVYNPEELGRILECARAGFDQTILTVFALTMMRHGEVLGLKWSDIDFDAAEIAVRRNWGGAWKLGEPVFWTPKTKHSLRTLKMPDELALALKKWKLQAPPPKTDLVFWCPNTQGRPQHRTAARMALVRAAKAAGVRCLTIHALRHSGASIHLMAGTALPEVSAMLGHGNVAITLSVYTHFIPKMRSDSAATLAGAIFGNRAGRLYQTP